MTVDVVLVVKVDAGEIVVDVIVEISDVMVDVDDIETEDVTVVGVCNDE